jgi:hypothetical protein
MISEVVLQESLYLRATDTSLPPERVDLSRLLALCGTHEPGSKAIVPMVSAWAEGNGLLLAQRKVDEKSNEITAIPKLLDALEFERNGSDHRRDGLPEEHRREDRREEGGLHPRRQTESGQPIARYLRAKNSGSR